MIAMGENGISKKTFATKNADEPLMAFKTDCKYLFFNRSFNVICPLSVTNHLSSL